MRSIVVLASIGLLWHTGATAAPRQPSELISGEGTVDIIGDLEGARSGVQKADVDTLWIATWDFEGCDETGWVRSDNRILGDGILYWTVNSDFDALANITNEAAVLGAHNLCWAYPDGYDNDWYQGLRIHYVGDSYLSFDWVVDSEYGYDFIQVETDSACASNERVDFDVNPNSSVWTYRQLVWSASGFDTSTAHVDSLPLTGYSSTDTHCVSIAFWSDSAWSPADGLQGTTLGVAVVLDNILLEGAMPTSEDFSSFTPTPWLSFADLRGTTPFGQWARTYQHITDNDLCTENLTCAWLSTDDTTPTFANDPSMAFSPGGYVVKNWLDEIVTGPWVSFASTGNAFETYFQIHRFPGNFYSTGRLVQNWSIRGRSKRANSDTPAPGDSIDCVSAWGHAWQFNSLNVFKWLTTTWDATSHVDPASREVQVRIRLVDRQWLAGSAPPSTFLPGPGPYWDRIRIGRQVVSGPLIDEGVDGRYQAQDAAANDPAHEAGPAYSQAPGGDIFGTTAFSRSADAGILFNSSHLIVGDSITVDVTDVLGHGGLNVEFWGAIVDGPHAGKAPAPYVVQANGFFVVVAEQARTSAGVAVQDRYFVDLDDTYFRGGDVLRYFWYATDAQGGVSSLPSGISSVPASVVDAEIAAGGLFEVNFLPAINWDPAYVARVQADAHGDLEPTTEELDASSQAHCILYYENVNARRLSGDWNRTSFMYTLDKLGYRGKYDVYDHMGLGNTNNHLGARLSPEQAARYALVIYDTGNRAPGAPILPDGLDLETEKIDMQAWFQNWNNLSGTAGQEHTLWILGSNVLQEKPWSPLLTTDMGAMLLAASQFEDPIPDVFGVADFTNHASCTQAHSAEQFALTGGCPSIRDYDALAASGTGVVTHLYGKASPGPSGAVVMNANAAGYTTILSSFPWFDLAAAIGQMPTQADEQLLSTILACALPGNCQQTPQATDVDDNNEIAVPARTALHANVPNPFNPTTTMHFDLARDAHVSLRVFDVAGHLVRTLVDERMTAGFDRQVNWDGRDDGGRRVPTGVYFYRLAADQVTATRKMLVLK